MSYWTKTKILILSLLIATSGLIGYIKDYNNYQEAEKVVYIKRSTKVETESSTKKDALDLTTKYFQKNGYDYKISRCTSKNDYIFIYVNTTSKRDYKNELAEAGDYLKEHFSDTTIIMIYTNVKTPLYGEWEYEV